MNARCIYILHIYMVTVNLSECTMSMHYPISMSCNIEHLYTQRYAQNSRLLEERKGEAKFLRSETRVSEIGDLLAIPLLYTKRVQVSRHATSTRV